MKIVVTSTQYPYYGGAATNAYALIKYFRSNGIKCVGIFFDNHTANVDPDKIGGVWRIKNDKDKKIVKKMSMRYLNGVPELVLAKNYVAPVESRSMFAGSKIIYLASGCPQMMNLSSKNISAVRYLKSKKVEAFPAEIKAIKASNFVIPNSKIAKELLIKNYGKSKKILKPFNTSFKINKLPKSMIFENRPYDIGFICSNFNRTVKNSKLGLNIFSNLNFKNKIVIGNNSSLFKSLNNITIFNQKNNDFVIKILSQTKLIICPSYYDASPNIIREAILCGCNILVSENCGWSEVYPQSSVCKDVYNKKEWINKSKFLMENNIQYNYEYSSNLIGYLKENVK